MLDVLVVGAGPTGLTLALELARRKVPVRLIDQSTTPPADHSRALAVQARTLEIFEQLGILEEAQRRGAVNPAVNVLGARGPPARFLLKGFEGLRSPLAEMMMLPQDQTEAILADRLAREGVAPERGVGLVSLEAGPASVACTLTRGTVEARWVVGCDGSHSAVRKAAGIPFEGETYDDHCLLGEVIIEWALPSGELVLAPHRRGVMAAFPVPGERRYRIICILPERHPGGQAALPLSEFEEVLRELVPVPFRIERAIVLSRYQLHHRVAARFRAGRLFLAGDAAHIHSPAGGQGMNTGIQDAWNLGWKLAAVVQGKLPEDRLDSYEQERRRVALKLVRVTDRMFGVMAGHGAGGRILRLVAPRLAARAFALPALQRRLFAFLSQLRIRYHEGPLVQQLGECPAGFPAAGERAPDVHLESSAGAFRLFSRLGTDPVLFAVGDDLPRTGLEKVAARRGATLLTAAASSEAGRVYGTSTAVLIRPDGYIGLRVDPLDPGRMHVLA